MFRLILFLLIVFPAAPSASAGDRLHVERRGVEGARPLVLVPGLMSAGALWAPTSARYEDRFDIHIVTLAGFAGVPPVGAEDGVIVPAARALAAYMDEQDLQDAVLVGHSIGGQIVLLASREADGRVGHIVAVDSLPFLAGLYMPGVTPAQAATRGAAIGAQLAALPSDAFLTQARASYPALVRTVAFHARLAEWAAASDQATAAAAMAESMANDWRAALADIAAPLTVLMAWDTAMPVPEESLLGLYRSQYAAHPKADIRVVRDSFHFIMVDRPAAFHAELDRILETRP